MRFILSVLTVLFTTTAFASGKLSLQNNFPDGGREYRPTVGLMVYEKLTKGSALNLWTGYGQQFVSSQDDVDWLVAKAQLDVFVKRFTVSPGLQYKSTMESSEEMSPDKDNVTAFVRVDFKLW